MTFQMPDPAQPIRRPAGTRRRGRVLLPTLVVIGVVLVTFGLFTNFWTDLPVVPLGRLQQRLHHRADDQGAALRRLRRAHGGAVAGNMWLAYRNRPVYPAVSPEQQNLERYRQGVEPFRKIVVYRAPRAVRPARRLVGGIGVEDVPAVAQRRARSASTIRSSAATCRSSSSTTRGCGSCCRSPSACWCCRCSSRSSRTTCTAASGCRRRAIARRARRGSRSPSCSACSCSSRRRRTGSTATGSPSRRASSSPGSPTPTSTRCCRPRRSWCSSR